LIAHFADSKKAIVADVDCTGGGQSLCQTHKVSGYPSLKYGDPDDLQDYNGGRSYAELLKFAEDNLGTSCSPDTLDLCSEEDKAKIEKFMKMEVAELDEELAKISKTVNEIVEKGKAAADKLNEKVKKVQKRIEVEKKNKGETVKLEQKKIGLNMMKAVSSYKKRSEEAAEKTTKKKKGKKKKKDDL
jgi:hypothetical protein